MKTTAPRNLSRWTAIAVAGAGLVALPALAVDVAPAGTAGSTATAAMAQPAPVKVAAAAPTTKAAAVVPKAAAGGARLTFSDSKCTTYATGGNPQNLTITCQ
jgi:hypothetical protein